MTKSQKLSYGHFSDKGHKPTNQDFLAHSIPTGTALKLKGSAFALADGISTSSVSDIASKTAVQNFLTDYYHTSDAWTVKNSVCRVLASINSLLYNESKRSEFRFDPDKGYVTTFSGIIFKAGQAHIAHVGDSRVYRLRDGGLEQLTNDHRTWISDSKSYLSRALGVKDAVEIDYQVVPIHKGDVFIIATDGVYEFAKPDYLISQLGNAADSLPVVAERLVQHALEQNSDDNLSIQIIRVDELPQSNTALLQEQIDSLPMPPELQPGQMFEGFAILRSIHVTSRSHCFLALDKTTDSKVVIKIPSQELRSDAAYLERFLMEEWIARRIHSNHVVKAAAVDRERNSLYTVTEYVEGQTLAQWLHDHPKPSLNSVRDLVAQIGKGLMAFHRKDMLHQDIKPDNILIDQGGTVKIIDFGSTYVAGVEESEHGHLHPTLLGTALYTAPEYFLGDFGTTRSDIFALGVLTYHMLSGQFPYGTDVAKATTSAALKRLSYRSVLQEDKEIPIWVDAALRKAVSINPEKRYEEVAEFVRDLQAPNPEFAALQRAPLLERNPVAFWQGVSLVLLVLVLWLVFTNYY